MAPHHYIKTAHNQECCLPQCQALQRSFQEAIPVYFPLLRLKRQSAQDQSEPLTQHPYLLLCSYELPGSGLRQLAF